MRVSRSDSASRLRDLLDENAEDLLAYFIRRVSPADDAADLVSETMLVLWRRISDVPEDRIRARMWMFGVARHVLANYERGKRRYGELGARLREQVRVSLSNDVDHSELLDAIAALSPDQREVVTLVHGEGFTLVEVASLMKCSPSTTRTRYATALDKLRSLIEQSVLGPK